MNITLSILLSFTLALFALLKKALTFKALIIAFAFSIVICYCGGFISYLILIIVFLSTIISHKIKPQERQKINETIIEKTKAKDLMQIIANVGTGTIFIVIYYFTKNQIFLISYAAIMAESMADSLASDIGVLSKKDPINILTLKPSSKGLSGNISILGFISSFIGSSLIGLTFLIFYPQLINLIVITLIGFIGSIIDSILGATIQVKYQCQKCHQITEKKKHCNLPTIYLKGIKIFNNDLVNLISNILTGLLSLIILLIT